MGFLTPEVIAVLTLGASIGTGGFFMGRGLEKRLVTLEVTQEHILEKLEEIKSAQK